MQSITGILEYWTIHVDQADPERMAEFERCRLGKLPAVVTGVVVIDHRGRWAPGAAMMSSVLVGFDLQNMLVQSSYSLYQVQGIGEIRYTGIPTDYALAVGEAILRLENVDLIVCP